MKHFFLVLFSASLLIQCGCKNIKTVKLSSNLFAKGNDISDSIFNGEVKYYDSTGVLTAKTDFINNQLNGISILYNRKGLIVDSINYINGLTNGFHYQFDDNGDLSYLDYSYFGLAVGPKIIYTSNQPNKFSYSNFDNQVIFYSEYDKAGILSHSGYPLNFNYYTANVDGVKKIGLKLYLIAPPLVDISYHLGVVNLNDSSKKVIDKLNRDKVFIDTLLPALGSSFEYYLQADYFDSVSKERESYFQKITDQSPSHSASPSYP